MSTERGLDGCLRCPVCKLAPEVSMEDKVIGRPGQDVVLRCVPHGHVAMGDNLEMAVKHWNKYIREAVINRAANFYMDNGPGRPDESYCSVCGEYTKSQEFKDRVECAASYCHAVKHWKEKVA